jgi:parvulin-like peptidyl-prolyl isomerase
MWRDDLLSRLFQGVLEDTVQVGDTEMRAWYDAHPAEFLRPEKRKIEELVVRDRRLAESLVDSIRNGSDMAGLARRYPAPAGRTLDSSGVHWIVQGARGELGHAAFQLKPGGLYGPIAVDSTRYAVIRLLEVQAEAARPFAEVQDEIRLELKRKKAYDALNALLEKRAPEYSVAVDQKVLSDINALEGDLMVRKSHFPNRFAVPLSTPFDPGSSWFQRILQRKPD